MLWSEGNSAAVASLIQFQGWNIRFSDFFEKRLPALSSQELCLIQFRPGL